MLAFAVQGSKLVSTEGASGGGAPSVSGGYVIGKEDLPVPGMLTIDPAKGSLVCRKSIVGAAAIGLPVDCGNQGRLNLRTCLLPDRDKMYGLEQELARRRIMLLLNKLEEWSWSDLAANDPIMAGLDKAREQFTRGLVAGDEAERDRVAHESLLTALDAGEQLAVREAERSLSRRLAAGDRPQFGVAVHADQFAEPLQRVLQGAVDFVQVPMRWNRIEPDEGRYDFTKMDRWIEWAVRSGSVPVAAGPVVDLSPRGCPRWLHIWNHDYDTLREFAYEHTKRVVTRYRRTVNRWVVTGGINLNAGFTLSLEQMVDLTRVCVMTARKLHPGAPVFVEISEPFGEHASRNNQSAAPLLYAELVLGSGVQADGFALRVQMGDASGGRGTRDLLELSAMLDTFAEFDKPLVVSALGCPSAPAAGPAGTLPGINGAGGHWRGAWSNETQVEWMNHAALVCLSKPHVKSVCWQSLYDTADGPEMPSGGLISADGRAKPALKRLGEITQGLRAGRVPTGR